MEREMNERIQDNIEMHNTEYSEDEIICPYCNYKQEIEYEMCFGDNLPDVYEEGEEELTCPVCKHKFWFMKEHIWKYTMEVKEKYDY